jgi:hypothetical protein
MNSKGNDFPIEIIKTAIDVCLETQNIELALSIAKQKNMYEEYLQILILKLNKLEEALDFISPPDLNNTKEKLLIRDQINLLNKFGDYFLKNNDEKIPDMFFKRIIDFIEKNIPKGEMVLVNCCETTPKGLKHLIPKNKPAIGKVAGEFTSSYKNPAKVVISGTRDIVGGYANGFLTLYK